MDCESSSVKLTINGQEVGQTQQHPRNLHFSQTPNQQHQTHFQFNSASDGSLSPQRNQSFIAAVISAIRNATTHSGKRLLVRHNKRHANSCGSGHGSQLQHQQGHQSNLKGHIMSNQLNNENNAGELCIFSLFLCLNISEHECKNRAIKAECICSHKRYL